METTTWINVVGLILNLAGVILLFRYGMPFRVRTEGDMLGFWKRNHADPKALELERRYSYLGYLGLALIVLGTAFQIYASIS